MPACSIVIPVYNEESLIDGVLSALEGLKGAHEIVVVDGGSIDRTCNIVRERHAEALLISDPALRGRARQMNEGAARSAGEVLVFWHADVRPSPGVLSQIDRAVFICGAHAGGFCKQYSRPGRLLDFYALLQNAVRARLLRHFVGTNSIFVRRDVFNAHGGFRELPLLEDVDLCDRLHRAHCNLVALPGPVFVSPRRYAESGAWRQILIVVWILCMYRLRVMSPSSLRDFYERHHHSRMYPAIHPPSTGSTAPLT